MKPELQCLQPPAHPNLGWIALGLDCTEGKQGKGAPVLMAALSSHSVITPPLAAALSWTQPPFPACPASSPGVPTSIPRGASERTPACKRLYNSNPF